MLNDKRFWLNVWILLIFLMLSLGYANLYADDISITGTVKIIDKNGAVKGDYSGVVVFLDEFEQPLRFPSPPSKPKTIQQVNKRFIPEVLAVVAGTTVDFPNNDTIYHNVFSLSKTQPFDLGLYSYGSSKSVKFDRLGLVKVYCNIHPQMLAYILVLANPYFTVTDSNGHFTLSNVPLGAVTIRTWYPRSQQFPEKRVVVTSQGINNLDLTLVENVQFQIQEETISIEHKNKWGQDYPEKY